MTAIVVTAANVGVIDPTKSVIKSYMAGATITKGQAVYLATTGLAGVADGNGSGTKQFRGVALAGVSAGESVDVLEDGELYGYTLAALDYDVPVYLSDTAGAFDTAAGTVTVVCGRVAPLTDHPTLTKVLRVFTRREADWS